MICSRMKRKILMTLIIVLIVPLLGCMRVLAAPLDEETQGSISVMLPEKYSELSSQICFDLYKVADIRDTNKGISLLATEYFSELQDDLDRLRLDADSNNSAQWKSLSQKAFGHLYGEVGEEIETKTEVVYSSQDFGAYHLYNKGLYIMVTRGVEEGKSTVSVVNQYDNNGQDSRSVSRELSSCILTSERIITVMPQIVAIPAVDGDGNILLEQDISVKLEDEPITGSIEIEKSLVGYYSGNKDATFVFQVDTYYPDEDSLYSSEVYSIQFTGQGTKGIRIDGIPVDALVKVKEVYSGLNYKLESEDERVIKVSLDEVEKASFRNNYNGGSAGGGSVTNHFEYTIVDDIGNWIWKKIEDNTTVLNGLQSKVIERIRNYVRKG